MSEKSKGNAKVRIAEALSLLMKESVIEDITISELIEKAGVGKSTFYRYYHDIYDVFDYITKSFADRCLDVVLNIVFSEKAPSFSKADVIPFEFALQLLRLEETDRILVDYLFFTKDMKVFNLVIRRFRDTAKDFARKNGADVSQAEYYTRFVMNGILYGILHEYNTDGTVNMRFINLLRSFSVDTTGIGD